MTYRIDSIRELPESIIKLNPQLQSLSGIVSKENKYHAKKTVIDDITFDSSREGQRYQELLLLQRTGQISGLNRQTRYELQEGFVGISGKWVNPIYYVADADYWEGGQHVVEDTKSPPTRKIKSYQLKRKMFMKRYSDIIFREVE